MRNAAGTADGKNAVFIPEPFEGKARWFIPLQQTYFHEGLYSQNPAAVITGNVRFRDPAFIEDGGNGSGGIYSRYLSVLISVNNLCLKLVHRIQTIWKRKT